MNAITQRLPRAVKQASSANNLLQIVDSIAARYPGDYDRAESALIDAVKADVDLMWELFRPFHARAFRDALVSRIMPPRPPKTYKKAEGLRAKVVATLQEVESKVDYWKKTAAWFESWSLTDGSPILLATKSKLESEIAIEQGKSDEHKMRVRLYVRLACRLSRKNTVGDSISPDDLVKVYEEVFAAVAAT